MRKITFILLLAFSCTLHAQVKTIQGQLTRDGKPLSKTSFCVQNRNITGKTDRKGYFVLKNVTDDDVIVMRSGKYFTFKVADVTTSVLSTTEAPVASPQIESTTDAAGVKFLTKDATPFYYSGPLDRIVSIKQNKSGYTIKQTELIPTFKGHDINFTTFVEAANVGRLPYDAADFFRTGVSFGNMLDVKFPGIEHSVASLGLGQRRNNSPIPNAYKDSYNASFIMDDIKTGRFTSTGGLLYKNSYERLMQQGSNLSSLLYSVLADPSTLEDVNRLPDRNKNDYLMAYAKTKYSLKGIEANASLSFDKQWNKMQDGILLYPFNHYTDRKEEIANMIAEASFSYFLRLNHRLWINIIPLTYGFKRTVDDVNRYDSNIYQNDLLTDKSLARNAQDLKYRANINYRDIILVDIENKHYFSNTLSPSSYTNMFPGVGAKWRISESESIKDFFYDLFHWDMNYHYIALRGSIKKSIGESPLVYRNPAALSTTMNAINFRSYYEYSDMFHHDGLAAETYMKRDICINHSYNGNIFLSTEINYFNNTTQNFISPVLNNGQDNPLQNIGEIRNSGYTISLNYEGGRRNWRKPLFGAILNFSRIKSKVTDVYDGYSVVPLAGFSNIATVFAKNEPVGAIYGTTYQRDGENRIIIGDEGFPLVDRQLKKIGDPTPDFVASLIPQVDWRGFRLSLTMEYSHGGQRWNGTRAYLDYLRIAEETGDFVRSDIRPEQYGYGVTGAGEEYIEDATYFRLSNVALSYRLPRPREERIFKEMEIGLRALNLLLITSYKGVDPSSLPFGYLAGNGLDLFNLPSLRSYSLTVSFKF
jgi:hypothetical protein